MHDNAGAHQCQLVRDFLESYGNCGTAPQSALFTRLESLWLFYVYFTEIKAISLDFDISLKVLLAVPFFCVYRVCPKSIIICIQSLQI